MVPPHRGRLGSRKLTAILREIPWLEPQTEPHTQRAFKLSYRLLQPQNSHATYQQLRAVLDQSGVSYNLVVSHGNLVDILPSKASKGQAIRFILQHSGFPAEKVFTAGDSGNELDMLCGEGNGIVVGNYAPEVEGIRELDDVKVYFSNLPFANGILDGLQHFGVLGEEFREHATI
jgi:sucrose-phosphate synthase